MVKFSRSKEESGRDNNKNVSVSIHKNVNVNTLCSLNVLYCINYMHVYGWQKVHDKNEDVLGSVHFLLFPTQSKVLR